MFWNPAYKVALLNRISKHNILSVTYPLQISNAEGNFKPLHLERLCRSTPKENRLWMDFQVSDYVSIPPTGKPMRKPYIVALTLTEAQLNRQSVSTMLIGKMLYFFRSER